MVNMRHCYLTTRDFSLLERLLERQVSPDESFQRLLYQKLSIATVLSQSDLDSRIATINSRVDFTVDDRFSDNRILTYGGEHVFADLCLPITTVRGLALLGLTVGETVVVDRSDGRTETIRLNEVFHRPQVDRKAASRRQVPRSSVTGSGKNPPVVFLAARRKPALMDLVGAPTGPDDDDPGPHAA